MKKLFSLLAVAAAAFLTGNAIAAGSATANVTFGGAIQTGAQFSASSYSLAMTNKPTFQVATGSTTIGVTADVGLPFTVKADADSKAAVADSGENLTCAVFSDASMTAGLATGAGITSTGTGAPQTFGVYGKVTGEDTGGAIKTVISASNCPAFSLTLSF